VLAPTLGFERLGEKLVLVKEAEGEQELGPFKEDVELEEDLDLDLEGLEELEEDGEFEELVGLLDRGAGLGAGLGPRLFLVGVGVGKGEGWLWEACWSCSSC